MSRLSPLSSKLQGFELRLTVTQPKLRIGKDAKECQLYLNHSAVSRKHCSITLECERGRVVIQDFSTNGTYLNRRRIPEPPVAATNPSDALARLCHGDELTFRPPQGSAQRVVEDLGPSS